MCLLCGETREEGRKEAIALAEQLERMAQYQRGLASGRIHPHTDEAVKTSYLASAIIRALVAEYV